MASSSPELFVRVRLDNYSSAAARDKSSVAWPWWKRALDLCLIVILLPLWLPLSVLIAVFIKMVSSGPVLFRQERVGWRGQRFVCFKFRSMKVHAESESHKGHTTHLMHRDEPMTKLDARGDSRLIPLGSLMRASGLDELPQLLNVLRGEMSLVGPRPCIPYEYEHYQPWQKRRLEAVPGLTGLWQVSGKNRTTFTEMVRLDVFYAENKTFWLDLLIILKTLPALLVQVAETRAARLTHRINKKHSWRPV